MAEETGCDAVMIGRAAPTNPWIFSQLAQFLATGRYDEPSELDRYRLLSGYFRELANSEIPDAVGKMKQFTTSFTCGVRNGTALRHAVHHSYTPDEILARVEEFFADRVGTPAGSSTEAPASSPL
jgi:tRNA-dihydrouridine synthase